MGTLSLSSGRASGIAGTAARLEMLVGSTDTGDGGAISIVAGPSDAAGSVGGHLILSAGAAPSVGGLVEVISGTSPLDSGSVTIASGTSSALGTGNLVFSSGNAVNGVSGPLYLASGTAAGSAPNGQSGDAALRTGAASQTSVSVGCLHGMYLIVGSFLCSSVRSFPR